MATDASSPTAGLLDEAHDTHDATPAPLEKDEPDTCRICRGEGTADEPFGSIKYVHQECLMEWLSHTQKKHCELCKTSFRFTKLYHPGMPHRIPTTVFIRRAAMHVVNVFLTWCRAVLVACVWLLLLPCLFWVGDGGWSYEIFLEPVELAEASRLSPSNRTVLRPILSNPMATNLTYNATLWSYLITLPFASTNVSTMEPAAWTFAKRLLFGFPLPLASLSLDTNQTMTNITSDPLSLRSPSLLSDVPFFNWFDSHTANRFIIDVLEGQIITLLVVVAFILIFLIREWVVQQQPVINMVALGENAAAHRAVDHEMEVQHDAVADDTDDEVAQDLQPDEMETVDSDRNPFHGPNDIDDLYAQRERRTPDPIPSKEVTESIANLDVETIKREQRIQAPSGDSRVSEYNSSKAESSSTYEAKPPRSIDATFPPRSSSLSRPTNSSTIAPDPELQGSVRPLMPSRDQSFIATGIRRNLEETNDWSFENVPQAIQPTSSQSRDIPESWDDEKTENTHANPDLDTISDQEQDSEHSSESWQQVTDVIAEYDSDQVLEGERAQDKGKAKIVDINADTDSGEGAVEGRAHDTLTEATHSEVNISSTASEHANEFSTESSQSEETGQQRQGIDVTSGGTTEAQQPQAVHAALLQPQINVIDRMVEWMFEDVAPGLPPAEEPGNDEHIVRNLAEEPPFVPFVGNEPQDHANRPAQDPEVAAAAAQAGIDVNDQDAIEDAEDLEGILELIGMQGPIIGLLQNVLFSAVLISATLACAVWLPYLWGKVVILLMGSPVSLLIKLPLQIVATLTDLIVDLALMVIAGLTYWGSQLVSSLVHLCSTGDFPQAVDNRLAAMSATMRSLAVGPFSVIASTRLLSIVCKFARGPAKPTKLNIVCDVQDRQHCKHIHRKNISRFPIYIPMESLRWLTSYPPTRRIITFDLDLGYNATTSYTLIERWTATDRLIAIFAGYAFFAMAGAVYLKRGSPISTSQQGQKIERIISDILQQAGGVLKVILIISIEMLTFPLYCGLLLDLAMLPLFKNATVYTRWQFACESPWTSGFVHWFVGTCYMFHFALFVSMCRKIMRKGVLYFIRDPDDPTFHPVRDVLERSVTTQLRKIAFSALVYGALVIVCLGGVVWSLSRITTGVLPIHWSTEASSLGFPLDLLWYNFLTPVIIKIYKPSEGIHAVYTWCFKECAGFLRLSSFLFGDEVEQKDSTDGRYVRAPGSDQARVPKGHPVFIEVDKENVRKDGNTEGGVHNSDLVTVVFIPNWFRVRIFAFVVTVWIFMGMSGVGVTILPLLFGRYLFSLVLPETVEMNDIHALSLGVYTLGSITYLGYNAFKLISSLNRPVSSPLNTLHTVAATTSRIGLHALRFTYVWTSLVFAIPFLFAVLIELYFLMPLHAYLGPSEPHVIRIVQDWTLGFLYSRLAASMIFANRQSRLAHAFNAVIRDGYLHPNARIATRCFVIPVLALWLVAIFIPSSLAWTTSRTLYAGATEQTRNMIWRFSFPAVGLSLATMWASKEAIKMLTRWRLVVRDEVYLRKAGLQSRATEDAITAASRRLEPEGTIAEAR
ncbi:hypothetical protein GQ44DRAFT_748972 [Phaeosphaeriaceae sp. PMI808]|nr:hypothetical protein GQ44DRAFT_748972 [Phaeosphaeriaceae sp. PMI808]